MKAPDKIYVLHPTEGILPNAMYGTAWLLPTNCKNEIEYIRKDALLKWLEKERQEVLKSCVRRQGDLGVFEVGEVVLQTIIDKLKSM